jgi:hypothetical protein
METTVYNTTKNPLCFSLPITFKRHGHNTQISLPQQPTEQNNHSPLTPMQKALIRGHYWLNMLEAKQTSTFKDIAKQENLDDRYVSRMINLTTLAPDIVAAILAHQLPSQVTVAELAINTPRLWAEQRKLTSNMRTTQRISH